MGNKHAKKKDDEERSEGKNAVAATTPAGKGTTGDVVATATATSHGKNGHELPVPRKWSVLDEEEQQRRVTDDYKLAGKLGEGSYGKVRRATNRLTGEVVAVKSVLKKNMRRLQTLKREISIMKQVDHPNIIKLMDVYEDEAFLYIVMELCTGGELFDKIIEAGHYREADAKALVRQMLDAVAYLHKHHIAHRDLKPENFLFASEDKDAPLKLIDFGLSRFYQDDVMMRTRVGTPYYLAPEVLQKNYDKKCDVWSIGVLMYILLCGYPPFYGDSEKQIYGMINKGVYDFPKEEWDLVSQRAKDLIHLMLKTDPTERIDAETALRHRWFARRATGERGALGAHGSSLSANSSSTSSQESMLSAQDVILEDGAALSSAPTATEAASADESFVSANGDLTAPESHAPSTGDQENRTEIPGLGERQQHNATMDNDAGEGYHSDGMLDSAVLDRLRRFAQCNKLKRAALGVIVRYLNRTEINSLRSEFQALDQDGNGVVTVAELAQAMRSAGFEPTAEEVERLLRVLDENHDGTIDYEEFLTASLDRQVYLRDELLETAFQFFDVNGSGHISREDLEKRLGRDDPYLVQSILKLCDTDLNGTIDMDEFKNMMKHVGRQCQNSIMELLSQGAEAVGWRCWTGQDAVLKERFPKKYRHPELERKLTKARLSQEVRCCTRALKAGILAPCIFHVNPFTSSIVMEFVDGHSLRHVFEQTSVDEQAKQTHAAGLGQVIAKLHNADITHGDLTTSNVLLRSKDSALVLIDFGLARAQASVEDKAVDLYVLERAFSSTHPGSESLFTQVLDSYSATLAPASDREKVLAKFRQVQQRGRKRAMIG
ncbi:Calcium-dependent protein kinase 2 (PfCDPK2) [Durusdinium trenchii]|uniref:Calcium-dependent protein kinase 2 (PfCDPK2) n=1 Tax=Durusdinium trenchii TaxID=1381693 RepID=A0ABP0I2G0_9DINO